MRNLAFALVVLLSAATATLSLLPPRTHSVENGGVASQPKASIQWFAAWESGLSEAQRLNRPILLVAAAPHCAGVSGVW